MANPQNFLIAGNDEHGQNPPTAGKRTPVMPYIGRPIYENEFNRPAKQRFLAACVRLGFRVFDVKPELQDISISERVRRVNARGCNFVLPFGDNAAQNPNFNAANGSQVFYATNNPYPSVSRTVSVYIADNIGNTGIVRNRGAAVLSGVGMLSSVRCAASLAEPGFMTNFREAKLMLDPDFQQIAAESSARALCTYYGVTYTPQASGVSYPTIRRGDRGQYVLYLQWMLTVYGYAPGSPDGIFGANTEAAVRRFQRDNSLGVDGIVGRQTWMRLLTDFDSPPTVRQGSRGIYVLYLQQKLLSKLYPVGTPDGIFGPNTLAQVRAFQSENGLAVDGIVGPRTWEKVSVIGGGRPLPQ